ncbi:MAG: hypothetical protein ABH842_03495 [Candidatus Micrarchaeota archaeon]
MKNILVWFLVCGFFMSLVHADIGPAPSPPAVKVYLVKTDGTPETSIMWITYHCMGVENADSSTMAIYPVNFSCVDGLCTNDDEWYYKFNPCFDFPQGYFSYELNGAQKRTENFETDSSYDNYELTFNVETGKKTGSYSTSGWCTTAFILLGIVGMVLVRK